MINENKAKDARIPVISMLNSARMALIPISQMTIRTMMLTKWFPPVTETPPFLLLFMSAISGGVAILTVVVNIMVNSKM